MPPGGDEALIPLWAADIRESVAEIKATTAQIPGLVQTLEDLRANQVRMEEHLRLRADVEKLKEHDLEARSQWVEIAQQVPVLWSDRERRKGVLGFWRGAAFVLGAAFTLLSLFVLVHNTGISVSFGSH